jgi:hypothetical protein
MERRFNVSSSPTQTPDRWLIIDCEGNGLYKVFATWHGGYLDGDSWRLNSGIDGDVEVDGDYLLFKGYSGSVYKCHKDSYGTTAYGASIVGCNGLNVMDGYEQYKEAIK